MDLVGIVLTMALDRAGNTHTTATGGGLREVQRVFAATLAHAGVALEVLHAERVPLDGGLVFMWNQTTHLDHIALPIAIPRPFVSLYNNEVARTPIYGEHLRKNGHVHVDRTDERQWRASIAAAAAQVRAGTCILVSPEGTRSRDGRLLPMKRGAFLLAVASGQPIVCITVINGHDRMPRGSPIVRRGPLRVVFEEPIPTAGYTDGEIGSLQARVIEVFEASLRAFAGTTPAR